jgi:CheY-like chemotaxis protein
MDDAAKPVRIMVVDDDDVSREVLAVLLESEGYIVDAADSGDHAATQLAADSARPDVLLIDMHMPGTVGNELARQLRLICGAQTRLIAISASHPEAADLREYDGFLLKPFTMPDLSSAIGGSTNHAAPQIGNNIPVLNEDIYSKLAASMQPAKLRQLYDLCLTDVEDRVTIMRNAASNHDDEAYKREAHAIKGGCGMVGATEMQTIATTMETKGLGTNHVASLHEFLLACTRLRRILVARL